MMKYFISSVFLPKIYNLKTHKENNIRLIPIEGHLIRYFNSTYKNVKFNKTRKFGEMVRPENPKETL